MQMHPQHLGGKPDRHDDRDYVFAPTLSVIPTTADVSALAPTAYNQMPLHYTCSANAIAACFEMVAKIEKRSIDPPSRLFLYYNARVRDGSVDRDEGASIRDAIKAAANPGTCAEPLWPYDASKVLVKPDRRAYDATSERVATYYRIDQNIASLQACIAQGFPFIFGMSIFPDQFVASGKTGVVDVPPDGAQPVGGHAVVAVGYDATSFTVLNSGGPSWGRNGYITMPNAYFENPAWTYDFWTIQSLK